MAVHKIVRLLAMLAAAGLLALALRDPAVSLAESVIRLWWLVDSLPQQLVWSGLALIGLLVTCFLGRGPGPKRGRSEPRPPPRRSPSQVERLAQLIRLAETSPWAREVLGRYLSERAAGLRAVREGVPREEALEEIKAGRWPADPPLAEVLRPEGEEKDKDYAAKLAYTLEALERYVRGEGEGLEPD